LVGAILSIFGAFMPWAKVFIFTATGIDVNWGILTLFLGVIAAITSFGTEGKWKRVVYIVLGLTVLTVAILFIGGVISEFYAGAIGLGAYVTVLGGLLMLVAGITKR